MSKKTALKIDGEKRIVLVDPTLTKSMIEKIATATNVVLSNKYTGYCEYDLESIVLAITKGTLVFDTIEEWELLGEIADEYDDIQIRTHKEETEPSLLNMIGLDNQALRKR